MEGNERNKYDDEDLNPDSRKKEDSDSDSFGLPDFEAAASDSFDRDKKEDDDEDSYSYNDPYGADEGKKEVPDEGSANAEEGDELKAGYGYGEGGVEGEGSQGEEITEEPQYEDEEKFESTYYDESYERKRSPVGWILLIIFVLLAVIVALFWWLNRDEEPVVVEQPRSTVTTPETEEPEPIETPQTEALEEEAESEQELSYQPTGEGSVTRLSDATNRYYVVVASAIDDDLLMDYAQRLAGQGHNATILEPRGSTKFHRLAIADFESLNDAAVAAEEHKSEFGSDVWVKRY